MSVIAFDYGSKRIGVAGGDLSMRIAAPREVIENKSRPFVLDQISKMIVEWEPEIVLVGLPISMEEGQVENKILKEIRNFGDDVASLGVEVEFFDERLSSFEAERFNAELGRKPHEKDDALAAQIILQRYFDSLAD